MATEKTLHDLFEETSKLGLEQANLKAA